MLRTFLAIAIVTGLAAGSSISLAQAPPSSPGQGIVSSVGNESVKLKPDELRLTIQLSEKGGTLKEVLAKLKTRCDAAKLQVSKLAATKESIVISEPTLGGESSDHDTQIRQMMAMRNARGGRAPKGLEKPKTVTVTATLTASWPLTAKSTEELLHFSHDLRTQIEAADLAGLKEKKQLSPEEEDLAAEAQEFMNLSSGEETPGQPQFVFVGRITDKRRDEATQAAFAKAKSQAQRLAKAAGSELGQLASLSSQMTQSSDDSPYSNYAAAYRMMQLSQVAGSQSNLEEESVSATPGEVSVQVIVQASFALK